VRRYAISGWLAAQPADWRRPKRRFWLVVPVALLVLAAPVPAQAGQATPSVAQEASPNGNALLDVVILVDESGSETPASLIREKQAAAETISQTMLNPASRVTVVGFGGVNGVQPNQDPIDVVCQPTVASSSLNLAYLATCVNGLHVRTEAEGNGTDYAAALGQAMSYLNPDTPYGRQSPPGATKVVILMTDGGLDVSRDPAYQPDWPAKAHIAVNEQLALARSFGVQIWPLGFGSIQLPDQQYLAYLASAGAQTSCDSRSESRPHAIVVSSSADVVAAVADLSAAASCEVIDQAGPSLLASGGTRTLQVTIPSLASNAAISVDKGSPGVQVSYYAPDGTQVAGGAHEAPPYELSGQATTVEVLHVADPLPGSWRVVLSAPPGQATGLVSAYAFWQGAVREVITADPPTARPGQRITVTVSLLSARGTVITDPATIAQLHVTASVFGDDLSPTGIPLQVDHGAGDALYTGTFIAPGSPGTLTVTGSAAGYGLFATVVPAAVQVGAGSGLLQGAISVAAVNAVIPGQVIRGTVTFDNNTGRTQAVTLLLSESRASATLLPGTVVPVRSGRSTVSFTIAFPANAPLGVALLQVQAVDAVNHGISYANVQVVVPVVAPPSFIARFIWQIYGVLLLVVAAGLGVLSLRRKKRRELDVRGLTAVLIRNDIEVSLLAPGATWSGAFRFVIRDEEGPKPRFDWPVSGTPEPAYVVQRGPGEQVRVFSPAGDEWDLTADGPGRPLGNGLLLAFRDTRPLAARPPVDPVASPAPTTATGTHADSRDRHDPW
jgi:hypothetical protein